MLNYLQEQSIGLQVLKSKLVPEESKEESKKDSKESSGLFKKTGIFTGLRASDNFSKNKVKDAIDKTSEAAFDSIGMTENKPKKDNEKSFGYIADSAYQKLQKIDEVINIFETTFRNNVLTVKGTHKRGLPYVSLTKEKMAKTYKKPRAHATDPLGKDPKQAAIDLRKNTRVLQKIKQGTQNG